MISMSDSMNFVEVVVIGYYVYLWLQCEKCRFLTTDCSGVSYECHWEDVV